VKKNPTVIEDGIFIGSGNMLVAALQIGKGSYTAAGSTLSEDVPPLARHLAQPASDKTGMGEGASPD